jgi:hypothetical protein
MARLTILFADDQIPDENIPNHDLGNVLKNQHPDWPPGFIDAFFAMRQAIKVLRIAGYAVTVARTYGEALDLIGKHHFDIAIVDLGWFADGALSADQQEYAGWDICAAIDEADKKLQSAPTLQIVHSNRFDQDAALAMQAADMGKLPLYKNYTEANHQALRAAVKFIETQLRSRLPQSDAPQARPTDMVDRWRLYNNLLKCFDLSELDEICFRLQIDDESLHGQERTAKARALIQYCERRSMLDELVAVCKKERPLDF